MSQTPPLSVVILGATGAVGANALAALTANPNVKTITVLARRAVDEPQPAKVQWHIVDVVNPHSYKHLLANHHAALCTFGVGEPSKASREEFQRIDYDAVLAFAQSCKTAGVKHFELLGAVAANPKSSNFYLASKGKLRDAITALSFPRVSIFQPSMLITKTNRYGIMQAVLLAVWPLLSFLLIGSLKKYKGVTVERLGKAMADNLFKQGNGTEILHWPFE
jgi:uncharacterized protein YbjT (DUF2867 family)